MADEKSARDQRLAEALRANLRRRKSQSRARDEGAEAPQADSAEHQQHDPDDPVNSSAKPARKS